MRNDYMLRISIYHTGGNFEKKVEELKKKMNEVKGVQVDEWIRTITKEEEKRLNL